MFVADEDSVDGIAAFAERCQAAEGIAPAETGVD
jgi:hypothetical protein